MGRRLRIRVVGEVRVDLFHECIEGVFSFVVKQKRDRRRLLLVLRGDGEFDDRLEGGEKVLLELRGVDSRFRKFLCAAVRIWSALVFDLKTTKPQYQ